MSEETKTSMPPAAAPPKKAGGGALGTLVIALVAAIASAAGSAFGPLLAGKLVKPSHAAQEAEKEPEEPEPAQTITLDAMVVDVRDKDGTMHHLRVGIALELAKPLHDEEEVKKIAPRVRDAAIEYMRALPYDDVTSAKRFEAIRKELGEKITKVVGKSKVKKVLLTDFVVQ
jgi:flagellar basal body-associated protein FliL